MDETGDGEMAGEEIEGEVSVDVKLERGCVDRESKESEEKVGVEIAGEIVEEIEGGEAADYRLKRGRVDREREGTVGVEMAGETEERKSEEFQVEIGTVEKLKWGGSCLVLAEEWPSWTFALDALGCKEIKTHVKWRQPRAREEFAATVLGSTKIDAVELTKLSKSEEKFHVFIQGSEAFIEKQLELVTLMGCLSCCPI